MSIESGLLRDKPAVEVTKDATLVSPGRSSSNPNRSLAAACEAFS